MNTKKPIQKPMSIKMEAIEKWLETTGKTMLQTIGIKAGHIVVDFGCGDGMYTLPCSQLLGTKGKIYSLDKEKTKNSDKKIVFDSIVLSATNPYFIT